MPENFSITISYTKLLRSVSNTMKTGLAEAERILEYQRLKTYWNIGGEIRKYADRPSDAQPLTQKFYQAFSHDLSRNTSIQISADMIKRTVQFYKYYPEFPKNTPLTFTHYRALMRIDDNAARRRLEKRAIKQKIGSRDIQLIVSELKGEKQQKAGEILECARGEPYIYCLRSASDMQGGSFLKVDCGFKIRVDMPADTCARFQAGRIVRSVKEGGAYRLSESKEDRHKLHTYKAIIERVVDGDTVVARIDVGFGIELKERLRLRAVNAPEIATPAGVRAKKFSEKYLSMCPAVVVRTSREGKFGRYLADIFALKGSRDPFTVARDGEYFNQVLFDQGLVEKY